MKLQMFKYKCAKCHEEFEAPELPMDAYGEFILRSAASSEEVYLNALEDITYQEAKAILEINPRIAHFKPTAIADVLRKTYGMIACDPDASGSPFEIGGFPHCPRCSSQTMESWEEVDPPEFVEKSIPAVSHEKWNKLSDEGKRGKTDEVLAAGGY